MSLVGKRVACWSEPGCMGSIRFFGTVAEDQQDGHYLVRLNDGNIIGWWVDQVEEIKPLTGIDAAWENSPPGPLPKLARGGYVGPREEYVIPKSVVESFGVHVEKIGVLAKMLNERKETSVTDQYTFRVEWYAGKPTAVLVGGVISPRKVRQLEHAFELALVGILPEEPKRLEE